MPIERTYACPDCGGRFRFLHMTRDEPAPAECELCGASFADEPTAELPAVHVGGSAISRSVDQVYAQLEQPRYDPEGNLVAKGVTNLRDGLRPGDVAAMPVSNAVTQAVDASGGSPWGGADVTGYVAQSKAGPRGDATGVLSAIQRRRFGG